MKKEFKLLIADKNPYIREFLKRELMADGYRIQLAENGQQVLKQALDREIPDLLILDPDLPDTDEASLLETIRNHFPNLPIVIHTILPDYSINHNGLHAIACVEKGGNSIEILKKVIYNALFHSY